MYYEYCIMYYVYYVYYVYDIYDIHHSNCLYIYGKHAGKKLGSLLYTCIYIYIFDAFELYSNIQHAFIHV